MDPLQHDEIIKRKYLARAPGDETTKAYIAAKYLGGNVNVMKKKKKKKRNIGNIGIIDEEESGWNDAPWEEKKEEEEELKDDVAADAGGVFKGTVSNWQTIREGEKVSEEDEPTVVEESSGPRMSTGQRAGILTKEEIKAEAERTRRLERQAIEKIRQEGESAETVYRDASGRKVDIKVKKAKEIQDRIKKIERESRRMEWGKGLVQRREAEEEKKREEAERDKPMARYVDDKDLNDELKERGRWNDPAAGFLTRKTSKGSKLMKPTYKGAWKPNRFMIPPGYRWDGVDRSTGYEDKLLLHQNQAKSREAEAHAWSIEDM
ncbi:Pre-mRNA-splicing factor of RES complex-domain-containing protein [Pilobolus umbonatus]|nr:Pre-mRNA-splicing factor of RES complex-domain-containing protein [Pilobolus umbonatus]